MAKSSGRYKSILIIAALILVPLFIYFPALKFEFVWDDIDLYLNAKSFPPGAGFEEVVQRWNPLSDGMYMPVTYTLWMLAAKTGTHYYSMHGVYDPSLFHLLNILLHIANGLVIFFIIRKIIKKDLFAFFGALLFLLHPIQVESVSWISDLRGLLAAFFSLLALYQYIIHVTNLTTAGHRKVDKPLHYLRVIIFSILAVVSKPSAVVVPVLLMLFDLLFFRRNWKDILKSLIPILLLIIPVMIRAKMGESNFTIAGTTPLWTRPFIYADAVCFYLYKLIVPVDLAAAYGRTPSSVIQNFWLYFTWIIPALILAAAFYYRKKNNSVYLLSALIFILGILPVSGLVTFYFQEWSTVADRYLYISMIGPAMAFGYTFTMFKNQKKAGYIGTAIVIVLAVFTIRQIPVWQNEFTLWDNSISKYPGKSAQAYTGRGYYLLEKKDYEKALSDFNQAIEINPKYARAWYNRGNIFLDIEAFQKAISDYTEALNLKFADPNVYVNRGLAYSRINEFDKAISDFNIALKINPAQEDIYVNRGIAYAQKGDFALAISDFKRALEYDPNDENAAFNLKMAQKVLESKGK